MTIPRIDPNSLPAAAANLSTVSSAQHKPALASDESTLTLTAEEMASSVEAAPASGASENLEPESTGTKEETAAESSTDVKDKQTVVSPTAPNVKLGKRLDLVANILEQELQEWGEDRSTDITASLTRQIELIRKMANESKPAEEVTYGWPPCL